MTRRITSARLERFRRARGFTLVELMVSLVAGLLVTIAVVGLARDATTTFYEQARLSTVEATVRSASERLRQDLTRASYMGTGNLFLAREDSIKVPFGHKISHMFGVATPSRYATTTDVQGIRILVGGSTAGAQGLNNLSTTNLLNPDALELMGNFTTDDQYRGRVTNSGSIVTLGAANDPAVARLLAGATPDQNMHNAFQPGTVTAGATPPFLARVIDPRGCQHFVQIAAVAGNAATGVINLAPAVTGDPILSTLQDENHTCGVTDGDEVTISPLQKVRWYIGPTTAALAPDPLVEAATQKFDLYREIVDATGAAVPAPGGAQVVAEYAVDLKFGITVDDNTGGVVPPNNQKIFDMDLDGVSIDLWTKNASATVSGGPSPQRVRAVRYRLATRSALSDRETPLPSTFGAPYISRYCTTTPLAGCKNFARVRTIMSEVPLVNQKGMTY